VAPVLFYCEPFYRPQWRSESEHKPIEDAAAMVEDNISAFVRMVVHAVVRFRIHRARAQGCRSRVFCSGIRGRILRRMPRMQVYLPDELYQAVKRADLPASELLQEAVRAEVQRRELLAASQKYTKELSREVGSPTPKQQGRASALARRIVGRHSQRRAG